MSTGNKAQEASESSDGFLSPDEVLSAAGALPAADKLKLDGVERVRRRGTGYGPGQLLHEVMCRVWLGDRKCPRNLPVMPFLIMSMRSIASHDREARKRMRSLHAVRRDGTAASATAVVEDIELAVQITLDRAVKELQTINDVCDHFPNDEEAQLLVLGWAEGKKAADLQNATGLDKAGVERVAKRIRKKMRFLYPDGRIK